MNYEALIEQVKDKDRKLICLKIKYSNLLETLNIFCSMINIDLLYKDDFTLKVSEKIYNEYKQLLTELSFIDITYNFNENNMLYRGIKLEKL